MRRSTANEIASKIDGEINEIEQAAILLDD
jgi:hypothetical protein